MTELRDADAIAAWMSFGLRLACLRPGDVSAPHGGERDRSRDAYTWFNTVLAERPGLPPPGCVVDLAELATEGARTPRARPLPDDPALRRALREWEDQVLGRLRSDRRLPAIQDAVAALPSPLQAEAAGLFASVILARIGSAGLQVLPGVVRRALTSPAPQTPTPDTQTLLQHGYADLVQRARSVPELIAAGDVFLLTWMERLRGLEARVALEQLAGVAATTPLPSHVRSRRRSGRALTRIEEDSAFPVGGFSSIQTSGAIENIVSSELAYMNPPEDHAERAVDLFDLRWAEGELLYYSRDEGTQHRERRALLILLRPELDHERTPISAGGLQRIVHVLGRLIALVRRLAALLGHVALQIRIVAPIDPQGAPQLPLETELLELLLHDLVERGVLTFGHAADAQAEAWLAAQARTGIAERLRVGARRGASQGDADDLYLDVDTDPAALLQRLV